MKKSVRKIKKQKRTRKVRKNITRRKKIKGGYTDYDYQNVLINKIIIQDDDIGVLKEAYEMDDNSKNELLNRISSVRGPGYVVNGINNERRKIAETKLKIYEMIRNGRTNMVDLNNQIKSIRNDPYYKLNDFSNDEQKIICDYAYLYTDDRVRNRSKQCSKSMYGITSRVFGRTANNTYSKFQNAATNAKNTTFGFFNRNRNQQPSPESQYKEVPLDEVSLPRNPYPYTTPFTPPQQYPPIQ